MGFLKNLKKQLETRTNEIKSGTTAKTAKSSFDMDEAYYDFEDHYGKSCEKKVDKIDSIETDNLDPDKNVSSFKKKLELCKELETFCSDHGSGGSAYFKENYSYIYQDIQNELDDYLKNEYAEAKEYFEEEKARQKAIKSLSNKILKEIEKAGGSALQKEIRKQFPKGEPDYFNQATKSLLESGKIIKYKDGNFVCYKISQ